MKKIFYSNKEQLYKNKFIKHSSILDRGLRINKNIFL